MSPRELGTTIRRLRRRAKLTQVQLAERAQISQPYLSQLEAGRAKRPSLQMAQHIAKALGVKVDELI